MKRKLLWLMVGLLVGSGIAAASLVQAGGGDEGNQPVKQEETDDPKENETSEVEDADEPGEKAEDENNEGSEVEDADELGDDDGPGDVED